MHSLSQRMRSLCQPLTRMRVSSWSDHVDGATELSKLGISISLNRAGFCPRNSRWPSWELDDESFSWKATSPAAWILRSTTLCSLVFRWSRTETVGRLRAAVRGLRGSQALHHVEVFGLIDKDDRTEDEIKQLAEESVLALEVYAVEALYYCSDAIAAVACRQAESLDCDSAAMIKVAKQKALKVLSQQDVAEMMAQRRCERRMRKEILSSIPPWKNITDAKITICVDSPYSHELKRFQKLVRRRKAG